MQGCMITVELPKSNEVEKAEVEIYLDREGHNFLIAVPQKLKNSKASVDDAHFMTPSWVYRVTPLIKQKRHAE